jgi:Tol biopolymer transport system component
LTPDWSPALPEGGTGGQSIVFTGYRGLMGQSVDGKTSWQLTTDPRDTSPTWSQDGTKVAYVHRQHDHWEVYAIDVTTGRQTRLTNTPTLADGSVASSVSPAWSPDGQCIAFLTNRTGAWQIWVMEANGSNPSPMFDTELQGPTLQYVFAGERAIDWAQ